MKGFIANFRRSRHRTYANQMIIQPDGSTSKEEAAKLVGKQVMFKTQTGREIKGEVRSAHGNSGCVRVLFETGMPGQAIAKSVRIQ